MFWNIIFICGVDVLEHYFYLWCCCLVLLLLYFLLYLLSCIPIIVFSSSHAHQMNPRVWGSLPGTLVFHDGFPVTKPLGGLFIEEGLI